MDKRVCVALGVRDVDCEVDISAVFRDRLNVCGLNVKVVFCLIMDAMFTRIGRIDKGESGGKSFFSVVMSALLMNTSC